MRKAMVTTAMVFEGDHPICLFVTGRQHVGENLDDIIDLRDERLEPIMQMSDGLAKQVIGLCSTRAMVTLELQRD